MSFLLDGLPYRNIYVPYLGDLMLELVLGPGVLVHDHAVGVLAHGVVALVQDEQRHLEELHVVGADHVPEHLVHENKHLGRGIYFQFKKVLKQTMMKGKKWKRGIKKK